ncbi:hypothetical protein [Curtobacterium sp. MCPF17_052]|nr:hypothetical protein [Curtobacterium sp. MCPF17_052]WIB11961.1 hypothetical protein DEJ36_14030 [Curtobacterium sp. MCPF17_052]
MASAAAVADKALARTATLGLNVSASVGGVTGIVTDTAHHTLQNSGYYPQ